MTATSVFGNFRQKIRMKRTMFYMAAAAVLLAVNVGIVLYARTPFTRGWLSGFVAGPLAYAFTRIFTAEIKLLPLYFFLGGCVLEIGQYCGLVYRLHWEDNGFLFAVLGATFDPWDFFFYFLGMTALFRWQQSACSRRIETS